MSSLSEYLRNRGLDLEPLALDNDTILTNENLTKEVGLLWQEHRGAITAVIQMRANAIAKKILFTAIPEEVVVLRQTLASLRDLFDDFEKYRAEYERREKETKPAQEQAGL